ncbi:MAG TPA: hypothetical protein VE975_08190, partial [Actinomycetota bacterium]|nr:hypothetical protein [Actinomycetota bacterium]
MEAHSLPEALNMIMEQRRCSQTQLGSDLKTGQSWVSGVITGERGLGFAKVIKILARVDWEVVIRPKRPKRQELDPVKRRQFTHRVITVGAATAIGATRSAAFIPSPATDPFKDPVYIRNLAVRFADGQREYGGIGTLPAASRVHKRIQSVIRDGNDPKVLEASAQLARQIAWTLQDACRFDAAENVGRFALDLAVMANDTEAQALAYRLLSNNNIEWGRADHAIKYAERGLRLKGISDVPQARLSMALARSLALARSQERYVHKAVESALTFNSLPPFSAAELPGDAGTSLATLANHTQSPELRQTYSHDAYESIEQAVASMAPWPA